MGIHNLTKQHVEEFNRLKKLTTAFPEDAASIGNLYRVAINANYNYCTTCGAAVKETWKRLFEWFEKNMNAITEHIENNKPPDKEKYKEWLQWIDENIKIHHFARTDWKKWVEIDDESIKQIIYIASFTNPGVEMNLTLPIIGKMIEKRLIKLIEETN